MLALKPNLDEIANHKLFGLELLRCYLRGSGFCDLSELLPLVVVQVTLPQVGIGLNQLVHDILQLK